MRQCIAELTGIKSKDIKPKQTDKPVRALMDNMLDLGFSVQARFGGDIPEQRHIVLYSDPKGELQAVLSDSDAAKHVKPISRLVISKDIKTTDPAKAGDSTNT